MDFRIVNRTVSGVSLVDLDEWTMDFTAVTLYVSKAFCISPKLSEMQKKIFPFHLENMVGKRKENNSIISIISI